MELVTIEVKLPKEVYDSASEILAKQGLTMEDALILFLKETVRLGRIPCLSDTGTGSAVWFKRRRGEKSAMEPRC